MFMRTFDYRNYRYQTNERKLFFRLDMFYTPDDVRIQFLPTMLRGIQILAAVWPIRRTKYNRFHFSPEQIMSDI